MEFFLEIVNAIEGLFLVKNFTLDAWQGSEYASVAVFLSLVNFMYINIF